MLKKETKPGLVRSASENLGRGCVDFSFVLQFMENILFFP